MRQVGSEFVTTVSIFFADLGPSGQYVYLLAQLILFYALIALAFLSFFEKSDDEKFNKKKKVLTILQSNGLFTTILFAFVILSRFPLSTYGYQNPDEGVWIACFKVLEQDPRPWIAADTATSGPLVLLPLLFLKLLQLPIDFGSIKLAAGITMAITLVFTFLTYCNVAGKTLARIIIIPATLALSLTTYWDFITYNGEHIPLLFLSISLFILSGILNGADKEIKPFLIIGFLLGMIPFAKLQGAPIAVCVAVASFIFLIMRKYTLSQKIFFVLSGLTPMALIFFWMTIVGGMRNFWDSYILYNLSYSTSETSLGITLVDKIVLAWKMLFETADLTFYFVSNFIICFFCVLFIDYSSLLKEKKNLYLFLFAVLYFLSSLYCIGQPYRVFTHYTYFSYFTINLLALILLSVFLQKPLLSTNHLDYLKPIICSVLLLVSILHFHQRFVFNPNYNTYAELRKGGYSSMSNVIKKINEFSVAGDKIAIWGWNNTFYGDTDLIMATRYTDTSGILLPNSHQEYFLNAYLEDLNKNRPKIFLDAITYSSIRFADRQEYGFDKFPRVKSFIDSNYRKMAEVDGYHVYVRQ